MLLFPSAEVPEVVLAWAVAGLPNKHIVKVFSYRHKDANKTNSGLKPILFI